MRLSDLSTGQCAVITKILGHGAFRKRVMEMGFVRGREVKVILHAPLRDPIKYEIMNYEVSLRRSEARLIEVESVEVWHKANGATIGERRVADRPEIEAERKTESDDATVVADAHHRVNTINVALIGNPNCGKTSLFNVLTGGREHVGNYSGVTVDVKGGEMDFGGYHIHIVDLPGTYSLASYSPEEVTVRTYLREHTPDVIINVVDASNLERNLYLTTELIDMDRSMVIAFNMYDELRKAGTEIDYETLAGMIGVPIVPTVSKTGEGLEQLVRTVIDVYEGKNKLVRHIHVHLGPDMEKSVTVLKDMIKHDGETGHHISPRYIAIKLLEKDPETDRFIAGSVNGSKVLKQRDIELTHLQEITQDEIAATVAAEKYGFISGALTEVTLSTGNRDLTSRNIDRLVTNKVVGFPLFFALMFFTFWLTFAVGQYPMEWLQAGVDALSALCNRVLPPGPIKDMVSDGIIGGVGGVIVFLPNILILYFCISFMEDTGYMARAAFIMDKVMHRIGLHGKSFIPLVMGFGCNVPAILGSRAIESRSSRIITILINPFMSCSARLPIYVLLTATFFPSHATLVFVGLYLTGIIAAVITARLLRRIWFKEDETPFVMELPPYRLPTLKNSLRHTWGKGEQYLKKMGGIILFASIIVWALNYFPHNFDGQSSQGQPESYLEQAGKAITPLMEPLGFHWRASVSALAGVPAKEIVVSTLGVLYTGDEAVSDSDLGHRMMSSDEWTPAGALSFMVFILLYFPCIATLAAIVRETGSWLYGLFSAVYNTLFAWGVAWCVYHLALLF